MKENYYILSNDEEDNSLQLKEVFFKYLRYWPWFLIAIGISLVFAFLYFRYAPTIYSSVAKIKIIDDSKELEIANDPLSLLSGNPKINLDNEIEVLKSYRILDQVVTALDLEISYYEVGNIKTRQIYNAPFKVTKLFPEDSLKKSVVYHFNFEVEPPEIIDGDGVTKTLDSSTTKFFNTGFPIEIQLVNGIDLSTFRSKKFSVQIRKKKETVLELAKNLEIKATNKNSEVLSLKLKSESPQLSEAILNEIIHRFDKDGILDRQLVSKRTMDFIDARFVYLSNELDSIEVGKKDFKQNNNLSYIEADAGLTIQKKSVAENEVFQLETQIELSKLLQKNLNKQNDFGLLPADIGLENSSINNLVSEYNQIALEREKLTSSGGVNNPMVKILSDQLQRGKQNIITTVNAYRNQLNISLRQLRKEKNRTSTIFSKLPEKEKMLRAIERQQSIKENLFLLLLQKREEAAINFAVTAPSVKVVDYGLTSIKPIAPKKSIILLMALGLGFLLPFGFLFLKFALDTKIKDKSELEKLAGEIPILAEIPSLKDPNSFFEINERSVKAESFRILGTNVNYLLPQRQDNLGHIVFVTSAIKGEGKTFIALNLSIALSSLQKKVLLVGADLRNPQLHTYFNEDKNTKGLSNFLHNPDIDWKDCIYKSNSENSFLDICFGGPIPPNAAQLIAGNTMETFLNIVKEEYDYVIVDTAPTVQVADTLLMSEYADVSIFITRSGYTDKRLIEFSKELSTTKRLKNMAYVLNDVSFSKRAGYNYGYEYGYGVDNRPD